MSTHKVVVNILINTLQSLTRIQNTLNIYLTLGPFTKLSVQHADTLTTLKETTLPAHLRTISQIIHKQKVQPPLNNLHVQPPLMGLLVHLPLPEQYSENALRNLVSKSGEQFNDNIRELNQIQVQEKELRSCLIKCRNDLQSILVIFPQSKDKGLVGKAIDWIF